MIRAAWAHFTGLLLHPGGTNLVQLLGVLVTLLTGACGGCHLTMNLQFQGMPQQFGTTTPHITLPADRLPAELVSKVFRPVSFPKGTLFILTQEYHWSPGRNDQLRPNETSQESAPVGAEEKLKKFFGSAGMKKRLESASDIIAVGMASGDGSSQVNLDLSWARGNNLVTWLKEVHSTGQFWRLDLGQFLPETGCKTGAKHEERAVLVMIMRDPPRPGARWRGEALKEHLEREMGRLTALPYRPQCYSQFDLSWHG